MITAFHTLDSLAECEIGSDYGFRAIGARPGDIPAARFRVEKIAKWGVGHEAEYAPLGPARKP